MYNVRVYWFVLETGESILEEERQFKIGEWKEIGFWLSDHELIDSKYRIEITVTEE